MSFVKKFSMGLALLFAISAFAEDKLIPIGEPEFRRIFGDAEGFGFVPDDLDNIVSGIKNTYGIRQKIEFSTILFVSGLNLGLVLDRDEWIMEGVVNSKDRGLLRIPRFFSMDFDNYGLTASATYKWMWILIPSTLSISDLSGIKRDWGFSATTSIIKRSTVNIEAGVIKVKKPVRKANSRSSIREKFAKKLAESQESQGLVADKKAEESEIEYVDLPEDQNKIIIFSTSVGISPGTLFGEKVDQISGTGFKSPLSIMQTEIKFPNSVFKRLSDWRENSESPAESNPQ